METIFIQIASYRDPELFKTITDCFQKAKHPQRLKFCVVQQYDQTEDIWFNTEQFQFIRIPHQESKGACWARNLIQQHYQGETYTLQLDSHHRFVEHWDELCIQWLKQLQANGYKKPILTAYLPSYDPANDPLGRCQAPWQMNFDRFTPEGVVFFMPAAIAGYEELKQPVPARFYSAHFCFTLGSFCREVQHDPHYYFHGEEISIAARAYTHGYDLFHPHQLIAWHEYTRQGRTKHWDDNSNWGQLNTASHQRNRQLFGMEPSDINFGLYGFGSVRTLADYEKYTGISFKKRAAQRYTLDHLPAPNPAVADFNSSVIPVFKHCLDIPLNKFTEVDYDFWCVAFHDNQNNTIYRQDAEPSEIQKILADPSGWGKIWREFTPTAPPQKWVVWPHSKTKGWGERLEGNL